MATARMIVNTPRILQLLTRTGELTNYRGSQSQRRMATVRKIVNTPKAPSAIGAYSQAVIVDKTMFVSGQIGIDPATKELVPGGTAGEAEQALKNMGAILEAGDSAYFKVVKTTVLLADINDFQIVNDAYKKVFTERLPARAAFQAGALPKGAKVEIEAVAIVGAVIDE